MIEVSDLVKYYGNKPAVKHISFTANDNEILGLLGPNGAGKSTVMNILTGYISMTAGSVKICGIDILEDPVAAKKKIGYLPETPPLYPEMTVSEYLKFAAKLRGADVSAIAAIARRTGISDVLSRRCANLSKGYKQRVGFACAILGNPAVIILDEPTAGLDPNQIVEMRSLIRELGETHTVILSSHILSEVSEVCGRVLVMNNGTIAAEDTPEHLAKSEGTARRVIIRADGGDDDITAVLDTLDTKYERLSSGEYAVTSADDDMSRRLFFAFAKANIAILSQRWEEASLEDAFIELTRGDTDESNI